VKSIEIKVGRLLEARLVAPVSLEDLEEAHQILERLFGAHPEKLVLVADYRRATVFTPEVADRLLQIFRSFNHRIERSGALVSAGAVFSMQIERLVANANNPARRTFRDPFEMKAFLGSALNRDEHIRLAQFLAEEPT
jgi:hypothetical protein